MTMTPTHKALTPTLPSDEVEFALKLNKYIHDQCIDGTPHDIGWNVMKMFSTRIAEMEEEIKRLHFMIENGLGAKDIKNDI